MKIEKCSKWISRGCKNCPNTKNCVGVMHVYIESEGNLRAVGFYDPKGKWHPDSDHDNREEAANRVAYLNGGSK